MQSSSPTPESVVQRPTAPPRALESVGSAAAPWPAPWVVPLGIACICYAALGMLLVFFATALQVAMMAGGVAATFVYDRLDEAEQSAAQAALQTLTLAAIPMTLAALCIGAVLLDGGIRLAKGRRSAAGLLRAWAVARVALAAIELLLVLILLRSSVTLAMALDFGQQLTDGSALMLRSVVFGAGGVLLRSVPPVAMFLLLRRADVRAALAALPRA